MYSTSSEGVTLQLRDADDMDEKSGLASVLARLQQEDGTLSISYQDTEMLAEGSIDVLLGAGSLHSSGKFLEKIPADGSQMQIVWQAVERILSPCTF